VGFFFFASCSSIGNTPFLFLNSESLSECYPIFLQPNCHYLAIKKVFKKAVFRGNIAVFDAKNEGDVGPIIALNRLKLNRFKNTGKSDQVLK